MENQKKKMIENWIFNNHSHHCSKKCDEANYPYVNSLKLIAFINMLWRTKKKK